MATCYDDSIYIDSPSTCNLQQAYDNTTPTNIDIILNGGSTNNGILILNYATNIAGDGYLLKLSETNGLAGLTANESDPTRPFFQVAPRNINGLGSLIDSTNSNQFVFGSNSSTNGDDIIALGRNNNIIGNDNYVIGRGNTINGSETLVFGKLNNVPALNPDASTLSKLCIIGDNVDLTTINTPDSFRLDERLYIKKIRGMMVIGGSAGVGSFTALPGITATPPVGNVTRIAFSGQVIAGQNPLILHTLQLPIGRIYAGTLYAAGYGDATGGMSFETAFHHNVNFIVIRETLGTRIVGFPVWEEISDIPGTIVFPVVSGTNINIEASGLVGTAVTSIYWNGWIDITEVSR